MEEEQVLPTPVDTDLRKPAFEVGPHQNLGAEQAQAADPGEGFVRSVIHLPDTVQRAFRSGGNFGYQIYKQIDRATEAGPRDPNWNENKEAWLRLNRNHISPDQDWRYRQTRNEIEANQMLTDAAKQREDMEVMARRHGLTTFTANALAGMFDIDAPLYFATGGLTASAKAGFLAGKTGQFLTGTAIGGVGSTFAATGGYMADPNADWTVIPLTGLAGAALGSVSGVLGGTVRASRDRALNELGEALDAGHPRAQEDWINTSRVETSPLSNRYDDIVEETPTAQSGEGRAPGAFDADDIDFPLDFEPDRGSIGARQLNTQGAGLHTIQDPRQRTRINDAQTYVRDTRIAQDWLEGYDGLARKAGPGVAAAAEKFSQAINVLQVGSDFQRMMNSGSAVFQMMAHRLMENSSGILRNNDNAARVARMYEKDLGAHYIDFEDAYKAFAKERDAGWVETNWNTTLRDDFNKQVFFEMQARRWDGAAQSTNPAVARAADALDRLFAKEVEIMRGRQGEIPLHGAENMKEQKGYIYQKWSGRNIAKMIGDGVARKDITRALAEAYRDMHPNMTLKDAVIYSKATINRAEKMDANLNTSMLGILQADGRAELADTLRRQGNMSDKQIDRFIERMTGLVKDRSKQGQLKNRLDVDARFTASNGIRIIDLLDTDLSTALPQRIRKSAGTSALARSGITSKADWDEWVQAGLAEQRAKGKSDIDTSSVRNAVDDTLNADHHIDQEFMDHMYAYFSGAPLGGGLSPMMSRLRKLTNLGLLNKLGLTQMYEAGNNMAAVGMAEFFRRLPEGINAALRDKNSPLMQEMKFFNVFQPEERLFRMDLTFDFEKRSTQNEFMRGVDRLLNKGQQLQGYTSGFNQVRRIQQAIAISGTADKLARHFKEGGIVSDARLVDMGFDNKSMAAFKKYVDDGTVSFKDGSLEKLNLDKWSAEDRESVIRILNARTDQIVMRAMAGESSYIFHKDGMAQLFFHLKSFALMTMEKQFLRNVRLADGETMAQFAYGLGVTGVLAAARNTIDGRTDRNDMLQLTRTALSMNHMTGWLPMWVDPVAGLLGMGGISGYANRGDTIAPSASVSYANKALELGTLPVTALNGMSNSEWNALSAIPIIGNFYGVTAILHAMKD